MPSIQRVVERFDQTRESRGQGESLHATLEKHNGKEDGGWNLVQIYAEGKKA
jgi:hypothetical protein